MLSNISNNNCTEIPCVSTTNVISLEVRRCSLSSSVVASNLRDDKMTKMTITIRANHHNDEKPITIPRIVTIIGSVCENSVKFLPFTGSGSGSASGSGSGAKKGGGDSARSTS